MGNRAADAKSVLIRGGRVIDPASKLDADRDVWLEDGVVKAVDLPGKIPALPHMQVIEAKGMWVLPGLIDLHVHFREPGLEYKETILTGSQSAVAGGFTSVACMANTQPVNDTPYVTAYIRERARAVNLCRIFPIGAVTKGLRGEELAEIGGMVEEGVRALSDDGHTVMNSYLMRKAMDYAKAFHVPIISHAEDTNLVGQGAMNEGALSNELGLRGIPAAAEEIIVAREVALSRLTKCPVHIAHISTEVGLEHVIRAKEAGLPVTAEASPHHLELTEESLRTYDTAYKMAPPLRGMKDVEALRAALAKGYIDAIATDHAPHGLIDKAVEFDQAANGIIGLQTAVPVTLKLVHDGVLTPMRWVDSLSLKPAKLLNTELGTLLVGRPADVTVLDPKKEWVLNDSTNQSKSANTPFWEMRMTGQVVRTIVGGRVVY